MCETDLLQPKNGRPGSVHFATTKGHPTWLDTRQYGPFGQLLCVQRDAVTIRYSYRPDGLRHSKAVTNAAKGEHSEAVYLWDGQNMVLEQNGSTGAVKATYLRGINLVAQQIDGQQFTYLFNAHGDVVQRIEGEQNAAQLYEYDAFGNLRENPNYDPETDPNPFRYCGEYYQLETNEYYFRNRDYSPSNGRFSAEDPAKDGSNWYGYCGGNPIKFTDPLGLWNINVKPETKKCLGLDDLRGSKHH